MLRLRREVERRLERQPSLASLRLRLIAALIDTAAAIVMLLALLGGGIAAFLLVRRRFDGAGFMRRFAKRVGIPDAEGEWPPDQWRPRIKLRYRLALWGLSLIVTVLARNHRSLGKRSVGLRRVELRTGGPVGVRAAIISWTASAIWRGLITAAFRPAQRRLHHRVTAFNARMSEIRHRYPDDPERGRAEMIRMAEQRRGNLWPSCAVAAAKLLVTYLPVLFTPRHQNLPDLLARLVVVEDHPARVSRPAGRLYPPAGEC